MMKFEEADIFMEFKKAVKYLVNLPATNIVSCLPEIIALRDYVEAIEKGCEVCEGVNANKYFVYCTRCGKKLGVEK